MDDNIGVFICTGYGIAEALDVDALCELVTGECEVPFCRKVDACEGEGLEAMKAAIVSEGLNKVVVAGISPRCYAHDAFPDGPIVEKVALREHVVWCQPAGEEDTQAMAADYLRMYIAKIKKMEPLEAFQPEEEINKSILVVGGGVAGLTAAREAEAAGYEVRLVEKSDKLGGWLAKQHRSVPTRPPYRDLEETGIEALIAEVQESPRIKVYLSAETSEISGAPGLFDVKIGGATEDSFRVGAIIQATGWRPTDPREALPYGKVEDVVRNVELEEMVKELSLIHI